MKNTEKKLLDLVAEQLLLEREKVTLDSTLENLGWTLWMPSNS